jgi:phosphoribosylaminoimidazole (AIR) synthetase
MTSGFIVGAVEGKKVIDDALSCRAILLFASVSGPGNDLLARQACSSRWRMVPDSLRTGHDSGDALLRTSFMHWLIRPLIELECVKGLAHITGGLTRTSPDAARRLRRRDRHGAWSIPPVFILHNSVVRSTNKCFAHSTAGVSASSILTRQSDGTLTHLR